MWENCQETSNFWAPTTEIHSYLFYIYMWTYFLIINHADNPHLFL